VGQTFLSAQALWGQTFLSAKALWGQTFLSAGGGLESLPHVNSQTRGSITDVSQQDINVLALVKGTERYVFLFDDASRGVES
jgi:hypothetical protein